MANSSIIKVAIISLTGALTTLANADNYANKPALDPVNFERIKMVDEAGDSFAPATQSNPSAEIANEVASLVKQRRFSEAAKAAMRAQDPATRRRLVLGIMNHLCQEQNFGQAVDIASYRISEQDLQALSFLMVAIKQAELGLETAELNHAKAKKTASKITDDEKRVAVMNFIDGVTIEVNGL